MIMVQWSCSVPQKKLECFLSFVKKRLKPFYESKGCKRYELFFPMITEKKYFPYQISEKKNLYTEQLIFNELKDLERFFETIEKDHKAQEIVGMYTKEFEVSACSFKILMQTV